MRRAARQREFYRGARSRINLAEGAVRSGKTVSTLDSWIRFVPHAPKGDLIMTGKTNGALYRNIVRPMNDLLGADFDFHPGKQMATLWGREIFMFGANDERAEGKIRGMTVAGSYGDELTLWPQSYWSQMLNRMSPEGARFFGSTNPGPPNHFLKRDYIERKGKLNAGGVAGMYSLHYGFDDNPFIPDSFKESLRREHVGLWYKRFILGLWVLAEGAVYDFFDEKPPMVIRHRDLPKAAWHATAVDYGTANPTGFGLFGVNPHTHPRVWMEREWYWDSRAEGRQKTDAEYGDAYVAFTGGVKPRHVIVDPSAASFKEELRHRSVRGLRDADNDVVDGIRCQARMLKSGEYALSDRCPKAIEEYGGYVWDPKAQARGEDKPIKQSDHMKDLERYLLQTLFGVPQIDYAKLTKWD